MEILLEKSSINLPRLRRTIHKITSTELSKLVEPCYYPSLKKYYFELLHACGLKEQDVKEFSRRFWAGRKEQKWLLHRDPISMFYIFLMNYLLSQRDQVAYSSLMTFFGIRHYTNLMNKQIKHCNPTVFKYTLEKLAKTHLFVREKTIPNALYFLSKEMQKKYTNDVREANHDNISKFITEYRHRISQSIKKFAEVYYKLSKEGVSIKEPYEGEENEHQYQQLERTSRTVNEIVKKITVYKVVDKKAIEDARRLTRISTSLATMISNQLTDIGYSDYIKIVLELFLRDLKDVSSICGTEYFNYVRSLMAVRRTSAKVNFKQQVSILLIKVLQDLDYEDKFNKLTKQTQFLTNLYLAYYTTMVLRNTIC